MTDQLQEWLALLAHPVRREILWMVWDAPRSATDIALEFDIAPNTVSTHLAKLTEAGFLTVDVQGTSRYYRANPPAVGRVHAALDAAFGNRLSVQRPFDRGFSAAPIGGAEVLAIRSSPFRRRTSGFDALAAGTGAAFGASSVSGSLAPQHVLRLGWDDPEVTVRVRCHQLSAELLTLSWAWSGDDVPLPPGVASARMTFAPSEPGEVVVCEIRAHDPAIVAASEHLVRRIVDQMASVI